MNYTLIHDNVYHFQWAVAYGGSLQSAINWFAKKIKVEPWTVSERRGYGHFSAYRPYKNGVLWFSEKYPAASTVAHECFHAVNYLAECLEAKLEENSEEIFAYYQEFLVQQVYRIPKK